MERIEKIGWMLLRENKEMKNYYRIKSKHEFFTIVEE